MKPQVGDVIEIWDADQPRSSLTSAFCVVTPELVEWAAIILKGGRIRSTIPNISPEMDSWYPQHFMNVGAEIIQRDSKPYKRRSIMRNIEMAQLAQRLSDRERETTKSIGGSMAALIFQCIAEFYVEADKTETKDQA